MEIPSAFIVSSKLSPLEPSDIPRIIHLAKNKCRHDCLKARMRNHPKTPIMAVGISNLYDMQRVMAADVPVIHVQQDCRALRGAQLRHTREIRLCRAFEGILSAGLWALYCVSKSSTKRRLLYVPAILTAYTAYFVRTARRDYTAMEEEDDFVLVRNDVRRSVVQFAVRTWVPYCVIGVSLYGLIRRSKLI